MKAALLLEAGRLEVRDVPDPECPDGGVLVEVMACGICSADAKMAVNGHRALVYPRILGHEMAGVIVGSRTDRFPETGRVQVAPGLRCGTCRLCRNGRDNLCGKREIFGFTMDGGFSETMAVPVEGSVKGSLQPIPDHVSFAEATLAEPLACCLNAQEKAAVRPGDTVLIFGAGPLGLLHAMAARTNGAAAVWHSEPRPDRRKAAVQFGACRTFDPNSEDLGEAVRDITCGKGVDVIILACSDVMPDDRLLSLAAPGGRISVFSGVASPFSQTGLDIRKIHYNELAVSGAYGCTVDQNRQAMALIGSGRFPFQDLITHRTTLDGIQQGLNYTRSKTGYKSVVEVCHE